MEMPEGSFNIIAKKADLGRLTNWHLVPLLCANFKTLSKALANRPNECMLTLIHEDQFYWKSRRSIFDHLSSMRDIITVAKSYTLDLGFLSLDQEKAFAGMDHS